MTKREVVERDRELTSRLVDCESDDYETIAAIQEDMIEFYLSLFRDIAECGDAYSRNIAAGIVGREDCE